MVDNNDLARNILHREDFCGAMTLATSASQGSRYIIADTSSSGTPTYTVGGIGGEATLAFDATSEIQNVCLYMGDVLNFDIDKIYEIRMRVKMGQAALDTTSSVAFGLGSARNDDPDSIAAAAMFRVIGSSDTTAVVCESDDGVNNNDDVATGVALADSYKEFKINFAGGTNKVKFYIDGSSVATSTTFDMSNYTAGLQPFVQLQKTADTNTDSVVIDYVIIEGKR